MKSFDDMIKAYYDWQNEIGMKNEHDELIRYIWVLPRTAVQQWKTELEEYKDLFREDIYQGYISQFDEGRTLLGIGNIVHDDSDTVKLYRMTEYVENFTIENILVSKTQRLPIRSSTIKLPGGQDFELPITVKYGSISLNEPYDLTDSRMSQRRGVLAGDGFKKELRDHNMIASNSLLATIDYKTGEFHIIRNNDENEENFIKNARPIPLSSSYYTGGGGSLLEDEYRRYPYTYLTVRGSFITLGTPVDLTFTFDCVSEDSTLQDNTTVINGILINHGEYVKQYIDNYDYDLGTRIQ